MDLKHKISLQFVAVLLAIGGVLLLSGLTVVPVVVTGIPTNFRSHSLWLRHFFGLVRLQNACSIILSVITGFQVLVFF
jgi:uncharacterized membrane-anchored protein YitT (DUF2179 family)